MTDSPRIRTFIALALCQVSGWIVALAVLVYPGDKSDLGDRLAELKEMYHDAE